MCVFDLKLNTVCLGSAWVILSRHENSQYSYLSLILRWQASIGATKENNSNGHSQICRVGHVIIANLLKELLLCVMCWHGNACSATYVHVHTSSAELLASQIRQNTSHVKKSMAPSEKCTSGCKHFLVAKPMKRELTAILYPNWPLSLGCSSCFRAVTVEFGPVKTCDCCLHRAKKQSVLCSHFDWIS